MAIAQQLSSKERYLTTMQHQQPDRVPILLDTKPLFHFNEDVKWLNQFQRAECLLELGCDPIINIWLPTPVPHGDVQIKTWREKQPDGTILFGKEFVTPKGPLRQVVHETGDWCDPDHDFWIQRTLGNDLRQEFGMHVFDDWNILRRVEPWLKGHEDLAKLPYILQKPAEWQLDEWRFDAQRAIEFAQKHQLLTMVRRTIVADASQWFCDIPWFMMQLYDAPGFVEEFLGLFESVADWQVELAVDLDIDTFQHRGWYDTPEFWGGPHFNRYIMPMINRQAKTVHQAGKRHCYLLTEGWGPYLDTFGTLETDILWGADPVQGKADLPTVKAKLGKSKTILGGISAEHHLIDCDPKVTRKATRQAIDALAPGGGFILAASSSIWPEASWSCITALIDEAHAAT